MQLDVEALKAFLETHKGKRILLFGFTFKVWQNFYAELERLKKEGITSIFQMQFLSMVVDGKNSSAKRLLLRNSIED